MAPLKKQGSVSTFFYLVLICTFFLPITGNASNWDDILEQFAAGEDVTEQIQQIKSEGSALGSNSSPQTSLASQLNDELALFIARFEQQFGAVESLNAFNLPDVTSDELQSLRFSYQILKAQYLIYLSYTTEIEQNLLSNNNPFFLERLKASSGNTQEIFDDFFVSFDAIYSAFDEAAEANWLEEQFSGVYSIYNAYQSVRSLKALIEAEPTTINLLRAEASFSAASVTPLVIDQRDAIDPSYIGQTAVTPEDYDEGTLVSFSDALRLKAEELNHDPIKIFEFIREEIKTDYYYGAMKGADSTLADLAGNDADQTALLVALLRLSGVPTRFVEGVVDIPVEDLMLQTGMESNEAVVELLRSAGYPLEVQIRGGKIYSVHINYVWASAQVPYANYRGASIDSIGQYWIPLFPSFKTVTLLNTEPVLNQMELDSDLFLENFLAESQSRDVLEQITESANNYLQEEGQSPYQSTLPTFDIVQQDIGYLPNSTAVPVIKSTYEGAELSEEKIHSIRFVGYQSVNSFNTVLDISIPLAELANQRVTLSYAASSIDMQDLIRSYGGLAYVPAYLISLTPQLKVNGLPVAVGVGAIDMGEWHKMSIEINAPYGTRTLDKNMIAGSYHAIGISAQGIPFDADTDLLEGDTEYLAARILSQIALRYSKDWYDAEEQLAQLSGLKVVRPWPSIVFATNEVTVERLAGEPQKLDWKGVSLDALYRGAAAVPYTEEAYPVAEWRRLAALQGSYLEHQVFEGLFLVDSISADKGLSLAVEQGIEIKVIDQTNIDTELALLSLNEEVLVDIESWVYQGYTVKVPTQEISYFGWQGSVWIVEKEETGEAGYFIAGLLSGGSSAGDEWPEDVEAAMKQPYGNEPNFDPLSGRYIEIISGNYQTVTAQTLADEPLIVRVLDAYRSPVVGAEVTFKVISGDGGLPKYPGIGSDIDIEPLPWTYAHFYVEEEYKVLTDDLGLATMEVYGAGYSTNISSTFTKINPEDKYSTQVGEVILDAFVDRTSPLEPIALYSPFFLYTVPDSSVNYTGKSSAGLIEPGLQSSGIMELRFSDNFDNPISNVDVTFYSPLDPENLEEFYLPNDKVGVVIDRSQDCIIEGEESEESPATLPFPLNYDYCYKPSVSGFSDARGNISAFPVLSWDWIIDPNRGDIDPEFDGEDLFLTAISSKVIDGAGDPLPISTRWLVAYVGAAGFSPNTYIDVLAAKVGDYYRGGIKITPLVDWVKTGPDSIPSSEWVTIEATNSGERVEALIEEAPLEVLNEGLDYVSDNVPDNYNPAALDSFPDVPLTYARGFSKYSIAEVFVGDEPGLSYLEVNVFRPKWAANRYSYLSVVSNESPEDLEETLFASHQFPIHAVGINLLDVDLTDLDPDSPPEKISSILIELDLDDVSKDYTSVNFEILSDDSYTFDAGYAAIFNGDQVVFYTGFAQGVEQIVIPKGIAFNSDNVLKLKIILDPGTRSEVESDEFDVIFDQPIFTYVQGSNNVPIDLSEEWNSIPVVQYSSGDIVASIEYDLQNEFSCASHAGLKFELARSALITLELNDVKSNPLTSQLELSLSHKIVPENLGEDAIEYASGLHVIDLPVADIPDGIYSYTLKGQAVNGVAVDVEKIEIYTGFYTKRTTLRNSLPIGHPNYEGVDLFDGHLTLQNQDFSVQGLGPELGFVRTYSSSNGEASPMGIGWSHSFDSYIRNSGCGSYVVAGGDGGGVRFFKDTSEEEVDGEILIFNADNEIVSAHEYTPSKGYHSTLEEVADGFNFYAVDGTNYEYRELTNGLLGHWYLTKVEDTNGNTTELSYNSNASDPEISLVTDYAGRNLTFKYQYFEGIDITLRGGGSRKLLTSVLYSGADENEFEINFSHDDYGRLTSVQGPIRNEFYTYLYEEINAISDDDGGLALGKDEYNFRSALASVSVPEGIFSYQWEEFDIYNLSLPSDPIKQVNVSSMVGRWGDVSFNYPTNRALPATEYNTIINEPRGRSEYTLNAFGAPLSVDGPTGEVLTGWSDDQLLMESRTDEEGITTEYSYDDFGNLITEEVSGFNPITNTYTQIGNIKNLLASRTDRNGHTTEFEYDGSGNLELIKHPDGTRETFSYGFGGFRTLHQARNDAISIFTDDGRGYMASQRDDLGNTTRYEWDDFGYLNSEIDPTGINYSYVHNLQGYRTSSTNAFGSTTTEYNFFGSKTSETDADGRTWSWGYDSNNLLQSETKPNGENRTLSYNDAADLTSETDFRGERTSYSYNGAHYQIGVTFPDGASLSRGFDATGHMTSETVVGTGETTSYNYDNLYRATSVTRAFGTDDAQITSYQYEQDDLVLETDALGKSRTHFYDSMHRKIQTLEAAGDLSRRFSWGYDDNGNLTSETDGRGNTTTYTYDAIDRLIRTVARDTGVRSRSYEDNGLLKTETDAVFNTTEYDYDAAKRLETVTDPAGNIVTYTYTDAGLTASESWPNGNTLSYNYDSNGRLESTNDLLGLVQSVTYDADDRPLTETDGAGYSSTSFYDARGRLAQQILPNNGTDTPRIVQTDYDDSNNPISVTDARGNASLYEYDKQNRLILETDPAGFSTRYEYDLVGNLSLQTDKRGYSTSYLYDDFYRLTEQADPIGTLLFTSYDLNDNLLSSTDKRGYITSVTYDNENRPLETKRNSVPILVQEYDEQGNLIFSTDANGNVTSYLYEERNLLVVESRPEAAVTQFDYNEMGDSSETIDPEGRVNTVDYDARRQMLLSTNGAGESVQYTYSLNGQQLSKTLPKGNGWLYRYDGNNRLYQIEDPENGITEYRYDANDNLTSQTDALGNTTSFTYNSRNLRTAGIYPDGSQMTYDDYDGNGNLTASTDANGSGMSYIYDAINRQTHLNFINAAAVADDVLSVTTDYDLNNNISSITETFVNTGERVTTMTYDDFDRLQSQTDGWNKTLTYGYDLNGNRTSLTDPNNLVTRYYPDALNRIARVVTNQGTTVYDYYRDSRIKEVSYPNSTTSEYRYDLAGRVTAIDNRQNNALLSHYAYLFDDNGNRSQQTETNGGAEEITTYDYDTLDRLTDVLYPDNIDVDYGYDAAYNRTSEVEEDLSTRTTLKDWIYNYNDRNQLTEITDNLDNAENIRYSYDANGNQTAKIQAGQNTNFVYDVRDHLRQVQTGGSTVGQFLYDYQGMRVEKVGDRAIERYTYDAKSVLLQYDAANETIAKYNYGPNRLLSLTHLTEGTQFYLTDALNSVVNLANADGSVQARYQYDAWGNKRNQVGDSWNRFAFTGYEEDTETGLLYAKARFYDPETGRFLGQDAWEGDTQLPPSLHKYLYAYQNPTVYTDPSGHCAEPLTFVLCAAAVGGLIGFEVDFLMQQWDSLSSGRSSGLGDFIANDYDPKRGAINTGVGVISGATGGTASVLGASFVVAAGTGILVDSALETGANSVVENKDITFQDFGTNVALNTAFLGAGALGGSAIDSAKQYFRKADDFAPSINVESSSAPNNIPQANIQDRRVHDSYPKDTDSEYLYRRDTRNPVEDGVFDEGFTPRSPDANVNIEPYVNSNASSQYVGTSKDMDAALNVNTQTGLPGYLHVIRNPKTGVDVNEAYPNGPFPEELEVAVPGGIDSCNIVGCLPIDGNNNPIGNFIENPNYIPGDN